MAQGLRSHQDFDVVVSHLSVVRGGQRVVNDATFSIQSGEVLGLIGPNGAGKSSTIGGLLGFYPLAGGTVAFQSWQFSQHEAMPVDMKQRIAYIPEQPMYYTDLTLAEHFEWKLRLWKERDITQGKERLASLCRRFQLEPHLDKFPHQCSKGTLQKMMVVSAFLLPFDVLIIDEPFIGLDVIAIREIRRMIEEARQRGGAVLISTHVLDSAERMCGRFAFMVKGEVFAEGTFQELREIALQTTTTKEPLVDGTSETAGDVEMVFATDPKDGTLEDLFLQLLDRTGKVG